MNKTKCRMSYTYTLIFLLKTRKSHVSNNDFFQDVNSSYEVEEGKINVVMCTLICLVTPRVVNRMYHIRLKLSLCSKTCPYDYLYRVFQ